MGMTPYRVRFRVWFVGVSLLVATAATAAIPSGEGLTPPRLSLLEGEVSFWRPGTEDWRAARANTPLAVGDALSVGPDGRLEIEIGGGAFVRAAAGSELQVDAYEPGFLRLKVVAGRLSLDLRSLPESLVLEVGTPNAALSIATPGYYRLEVDDGATRCTVRSGGQLQVTSAAGGSQTVGNGLQIYVAGGPIQVTSPEAGFDAWDEWNRARTDERLGSESRRYIGDQVSGAADLDRYGRWRVVPTYGRVWVPDVGLSWVPYSNGDWLYDPYYGWSWLDASPWGWAPFHYGRWVWAHSYWAWAPGVLTRPVYAPALVAFFGGSGFSVGIGIGVPAISWVALGWGEPCVPWWGPVGFAGSPWWGGWGGPRVINKTYIDNRTYVNIDTVNVYEHARNRRGVVGVARDRFGNGPVEGVRLGRIESQRLLPAQELLPRRPAHAGRPPRADNVTARGRGLDKPVVSSQPGTRRGRAAAAPQALASAGGPDGNERREPRRPGRALPDVARSAPDSRVERAPAASSRGDLAIAPGRQRLVPRDATEPDWQRLRVSSSRSRDVSAARLTERGTPRSIEARTDTPPRAPRRVAPSVRDDAPPAFEARQRAPRGDVGREVAPGAPAAPDRTWDRRIERQHPQARNEVRDQAPPAYNSRRADSAPSVAAVERAPRRPAAEALAPSAPRTQPRIDAPQIQPRMGGSGPVFQGRQRSALSVPSGFGGEPSRAEVRQPRMGSGSPTGSSRGEARRPRQR